MKKVFVVGVGMTKFEKPGGRDWDYPDMARIAGQRALEDACLKYSDIDQVAVGYVYGETTAGQRAVYELGMTGVPVYNVNNACATGSTALYMAKQFIQGGMAECVMALGFEKMQKGSLKGGGMAGEHPMQKHFEKMMELAEFNPSPPTAQIFANAGKEYQTLNGTPDSAFAKIAEKNHRNSVNNPYSQFQTYYSIDQISGSPTVCAPLTKLQCCPTSDGAACSILASEEFVIKHGLQGQAVEILGLQMSTDTDALFKEDSLMKLAGTDLTKNCAKKVYLESKVSPTEIDVAEMHDCFSANELISYEGLGFCEAGRAGEFVEEGKNDYGGDVVCNPSGGLISKGHPLGATGLAQCAEICWQLRAEAGKRQVKDAKTGLTHNVGLGGAAVIGVYRIPDKWQNVAKKRLVSLAQGPKLEETAKL